MHRGRGTGGAADRGRQDLSGCWRPQAAEHGTRCQSRPNGHPQREGRREAWHEDDRERRIAGLGPQSIDIQGGRGAGGQRCSPADLIMLDQPEYVHAITNHLPLIGLLAAMLALIAALVTKDRTATLIGLALVCLFALSAWPVYHYGEAGYDRVLSMADDAGGKFLEHHKALAERWIFLYFVTAGVAGLGFVLAWKWPRTLVFSSILALVQIG